MKLKLKMLQAIQWLVIFISPVAALLLDFFLNNNYSDPHYVMWITLLTGAVIMLLSELKIRDLKSRILNNKNKAAE